MNLLIHDYLSNLVASHVEDKVLVVDNATPESIPVAILEQEQNKGLKPLPMATFMQGLLHVADGPGHDAVLFVDNAKRDPRRARRRSSMPCCSELDDSKTSRWDSVPVKLGNDESRVLKPPQREVSNSNMKLRLPKREESNRSLQKIMQRFDNDPCTGLRIPKREDSVRDVWTTPERRLSSRHLVLRRPTREESIRDLMDGLSSDERSCPLVLRQPTREESIRDLKKMMTPWQTKEIVDDKPMRCPPRQTSDTSVLENAVESVGTERRLNINDDPLRLSNVEEDSVVDDDDALLFNDMNGGVPLRREEGMINDENRVQTFEREPRTQSFEKEQRVQTREREPNRKPTRRRSRSLPSRSSNGELQLLRVSVEDSMSMLHASQGQLDFVVHAL